MKSKKETSGFYDGRSWFDGLGFSEHGLMNHLLLAWYYVSQEESVLISDQKETANSSLPQVSN